MKTNFIQEKIDQEIKAISDKKNILVAVKGLPISLIPIQLRDECIDKEIINNNKIVEDIFFSRAFGKKLQIELLQDSESIQFILYESLLQSELYRNKLIEKEILILDFSVNSYQPNNFSKFNHIISELNEKAEFFNIDIYESIIANSVKVRDLFFIQFRDQELLESSEVKKIFVPEDWDYASLNSIDENDLLENDWVFNPDDLLHLEWISEILNNEKDNVKIYVDNETIKNTSAIEEIGKIINICRLLNLSIDIIRIKHDLQKVGRSELKNLLKKHWFSDDFRNLKVYVDPDISKETIEISQADVVETIIQQYENGNIHNKDVQDIFLTAPTGAGKSLLFQMPAMYLGEKYNALSIVITPLKALMVDQVDQLRNKRDFRKVAYINSDITIIKRDEIIEGIGKGEIDILYMAPELLLSYDISYFLKGRKLGLYIVDEAHTVSTWGRDFRIDYWYLGFHIQRVRKYATDFDGKKLKFPVVAVTATAPYGSVHDVAFETMKGLQMKSPIKYIGYAKRENIEFEIYHKDYTGNLQSEKVKQTVNRIEEFENNKDKTIVYCPFVTQVNEVYKTAESKNLNINRYYGSLEEGYREDSYNNFKQKKFTTMIATKAFGMGIDIKDINRVYHFAPTGLLTDYIQEIGRAARDKEVVGKATLDYSTRDFQFINQLHGLSRMHNWQLREVLRRLVKIYDEKQEQNHLLNIESFANIFNKENSDDLNREVKKALLLLEKDLNAKFSNIPVLIARPKNMFSTVFASIKEDQIEEFGEKYGEDNITVINYMPIEHHKKKILHIKLDNIWEKHFRDKSFGIIKKDYFQEKLFEDFEITPKLKIDIKINASYGTTMQRLKEYFAIIERALVAENGFFNTRDFKIHLVYHGLTGELADRISDIFLSMFSQTAPYGVTNLNIDDVRKYSNFLQARRNKGEVENKYRLVNNAFGLVAKNIKGEIVKNFKNSSKRSMYKYTSIDSGQKYLYIKVGQVLELLDLGGYQVTGGENPRMFVRMNDPFRLKIESRRNYENSLLNDVHERHRKGIDLMKNFFETPMTSDQRWDFLEDYLLGKKD